jgi:hypothetical protein
VRRYRDLAPEPRVPRSARALVREAGLDWEIPVPTENAAALVVSELAANVVAHTGTPLARASRRRHRQSLVGQRRDLRPSLPLRLSPAAATSSLPRPRTATALLRRQVRGEVAADDRDPDSAG